MKITAEDLAKFKKSAYFYRISESTYVEVENQIEAALQLDFDISKAGYNNRRPNRDPSREGWIEVL